MKVILCTSLLLVVTISASPVGQCPPEFDPDNLAFLPDTDCTKFHICSQSGPSEKTCPSGLHWNPVANVCDWPALAGCDPASTGSPAPGTTSEGTTVVSSTPDRTTTTASVATEPSTTELPPVTVSTTTAGTTAGTPAGTTPTPGTPTGECPHEIDPEHPVFLPHSDCSKFYICSEDGPVESKCPAGLQWNQGEGICDWPEVAGCVPGFAASSNVNRDAVGQCPELYDPENEVFLPHASDCGRYYICTWEGVAVLQRCPPGLHWNRNADQCDWPAAAGCVLERDPLFKKLPLYL